jgi:hypothetical protein
MRRAALLFATAAGICAAVSVPAAQQTQKPEPARTIRSVDYTFTLSVQSGLPAPDRRRAGGSIAALGDDFLVVTAAGDFYRLMWVPGSNTLKPRKLGLSVPFNRAALLKESGEDAARPFRILDLLAEERDGMARLYVAHHHWDPAEHCVTLRVSSTPLLETAAAAMASGAWQTMFESKPCLPVGKMWPMGEQADRSGGRIARHEQGLLVTVGDYGFDGLEGVASFPQDASASYGKVMLLDPTGGAVPFSTGHRNQQGMTVDSQGRVWTTEHGPQGGDELNLVVRHGDYGWPAVSYGVEYETDNWPHSPDLRNHGLFREPALAFVPSVALSEVIQIKSSYLPRWTGDLLLASLQAGSFYRVRVAGDRVVYSERIDLSTRIRDVVEAADGRIVFWNDDGEVVVMARQAPDTIKR